MMTDNINQAREWAVKKYYDYKDIEQGLSPAIVLMTLDISRLSQLEGKVFEEPSIQWAEFVFNCRRLGRKGGMYHNDDYICDPLADGKIVPLLKG